MKKRMKEKERDGVWRKIEGQAGKKRRMGGSTKERGGDEKRGGNI